MFEDKDLLWWLEYLWAEWVGPLVLIVAPIVLAFVVLMKATGLW